MVWEMNEANLKSAYAGETQAHFLRLPKKDRYSKQVDWELSCRLSEITGRGIRRLLKHYLETSQYRELYLID